MSARVDSLHSLLLQSYPSPEWAVFFEVANATGGLARRRADAVALGIWPSRGFTVAGFEFKSDRRDWLREKARPEKADTIAAHCDQWWLVTTDDAIARPEELPEPWGLYVAKGSRLMCRKPCVPFADRDRTQMKRSFVASMLRKVAETTVPRAAVADIVKQRVEQALAATRDGIESEVLRRDVARLENILKVFKETTGVDLQSWSGTERIAKAVDAVLNLEYARRDLESLQQRLAGVSKDIRDAITEWPVGLGAKKAS